MNIADIFHKLILIIQRYALPLVIFALTLIRFNYQAIDEEAFIILRYAKNIADGFGFVWNPGEAPLWGSTSLLWTFMLAIGRVLTGFTLPIVAQILGVTLSGILIIMVCYSCKDWISANVIGSILALSTLAGHALVGMDVVLFSLLMLLSYLYRDDWQKLLVFSILLIITRPEGAIIAVAFVFIQYYQKRNIKLPVYFGIASAVILLILFLYFGDIVPNPYYVKVGSPDFERNIRAGLYALTVIQGLLPTVLIASYLLQSDKQEITKTLIALLPAILYYAAYMAVYQSQNILGRFQFPIIPILLIASAPAIKLLFRQPGTKLHAIVFVCLLGLLLVAEYNDTASVVGPNIEDQNRAYVGQALSGVHGHTMAVTDAGMIPFYSEWRVIDILGLNDKTIAHYGLSIEYLDGIDIQLYMFGWDGTLGEALNFSSDVSEYEHLIALHYFIDQKNFSLVCSVPYTIDTGRLSHYLIAPSFEGRDDVIQALCTIDIPYAFNMLMP